MQKMKKMMTTTMKMVLFSFQSFRAMSVRKPTQSVTRIRRRIDKMQEKLCGDTGDAATTPVSHREPSKEIVRPRAIRRESQANQHPRARGDTGDAAITQATRAKVVEELTRSSFSPHRLRPGPKSPESSPHPWGLRSLKITHLGFIEALDPLPVRPLGVGVGVHLHDASAESCCNVVLLGTQPTVKDKEKRTSMPPCTRRGHCC